MPRDVVVAAAAFTPAPQNQLPPTACAATTQGLDCFPRKRAGIVVFIVLELGYRHHVRYGGPGGNSQNTHGIAITPAMASAGLMRRCFKSPSARQEVRREMGLGTIFRYLKLGRAEGGGGAVRGAKQQVPAADLLARLV